MAKSRPWFEIFGAAGRSRALLAAACCLWLAAAAGAQTSPPASSAAQNAGQKPSATAAQTPSAGAKPSATAAAQAAPPAVPGDWEPQLLYDIWNSPTPQAAEVLYRAAFAAGPAIIPQLQAALKDDRTATFAAQSLAFIGGEQALKILATLEHDPRDLDLRLYYYGALGGEETPQAVGKLVEVVRNSDAEDDRSVTEAAVLALSVHSDPSVAAALHQALQVVNDPVISDDIDSAISVITARSRYLAARRARGEKFSIQRAVRTYFIAALDPALSVPAGEPPPHFPHVEVKIQSLTFSPDRQRALAHVYFEDPQALAEYDLVLQKRGENWTLSSVWLGEEHDKQPAPIEAAPAKPAPIKRAPATKKAPPKP